MCSPDKTHQSDQNRPSQPIRSRLAFTCPQLNAPCDTPLHWLPAPHGSTRALRRRPLEACVPSAASTCGEQALLTGPAIWLRPLTPGTEQPVEEKHG
ncbi:hypothetical protein SKAU_G00253160 [Synaphobranchus kaupii]|uniref:Uncharacterized protein n=1 Tax=Synaphobranchus kaupii TaxID=118154 RepID=A0A9Q1F3G7_SYNKA|nr:hypothetical protein SKAU_G00253160 [Synaphobranchus kaupii]